ncbi:uncharacterized protein [Clytia hemisphaerica]|uniref:uncharacterized protein n=1 Tax=Clytia hemisphaerica TaxID=252671 RepID=UPI0034D68A8E
MAKNKNKAINELKNGLDKFRADALKKGWEEDEVEEKITEVFENFPWYKYNPQKRSWKSKIFNFMLFSFILYLLYGAAMEKNRRLKKRIDDYIFDSELSYHTHRLLRIVTLPIFKIYDLSKLHDQDCIINNPFKAEEQPDCGFCQGITKIPTGVVDSPDVADMVAEDEPFVLNDVANYYDAKITFQDLKQIFEKNPKELDEAVCDIRKADFKSMSDFFKQIPDEQTMNEKNLSIEWSNCHTYGTRFYRKIFLRPSFISKESEISFEKRLYFLQKGENSTVGPTEARSFYLYQVQGESTFEMKVQESCHYNCTTVPLTTTLKQGGIVVFPAAAGWMNSFKAVGDGLNILFLSSFQ